MSVATYASFGISAAGGAPGTDLDALIVRIRRDIALRGDEQMFCAVWHDFSPELECLVDYLPGECERSESMALGNHVERMPAWQILKILLAQQAPMLPN